MTSAMGAPVALLGGTFDPVHYGHLRPAIELLEALNFAEIRLVPGRVPPHRPQPRQSAATRTRLLSTAVADIPGLVVDERELQRPGPSYTLETLRGLRAEIGAQRPLCFVMGRDAFRGLEAWHRWRELIDYAHLIVTTRAGDQAVLPASLQDWLAPRLASEAAVLRDTPAGAVWFQPVSELAISATSVRQLLAQGRSPRGLVPECVWPLVAETGLYGYPQI